ncbi:MAG: ATP-binding protein [Thiogranum sp.]
MNGVSDHYSLQHSADQDLARRAQASGLVYIALYTIIILFTRYANDHRTMAVLAGLTILVAATLRTWMILKFDSLYKLDPGAWLAGFSALTVLLAGVWGAFCAHTVLDYGLELTAMLTLLTTAGISAGAITTLSIRRDLILLCLMLLLLPSTVAALLQTTETLAIALLFLTYFIFLFVVARRINKEYWDALHNTVLLDQRARELAASNQELESYSYSIAHDLRTPLRSIIGFSQLLLEDGRDKFSESEKHDLKRVISAGIHMAQLIDDILELSRITRGDIASRETDLSETAQVLAQQLTDENPGRSVTFQIQPGLRTVGDPSLLHIALHNLISNAWKFTANNNNARIIFNSEKEGNEVVYCLCDNGVGFDMAYADQLFRPFSRLHDETEFPGTGVGLATVQRVILRHGGRIWAEATPGEGACFYFSLR